MDHLRAAGFTADQIETGGHRIRTTLEPAASATVGEAVDRNLPTAQDGVATTFGHLGDCGHGAFGGTVAAPPAGTVIAQSPQGNVTAGTATTLSTSAGPPA